MLNQTLISKTLKAIVLIICFLAGGSTATAQCQSWTYGHILANWYLNFFKSNCDKYTINGVPDVTKCYWANSGGACFAYMRENNHVHQDSNNKPFRLMPVQYVSETERRCWYKYANNNGGPFELGLVIREDVPQQPYQPHCDADIQGPYRNCSDRWYSPNAGMWLDERPVGGYFTTAGQTRTGLFQVISGDHTAMKILRRHQKIGRQRCRLIFLFRNMQFAVAPIRLNFFVTAQHR
jgi:hypothetical protein